jgi:hypothetical protein
MKTSQKRTLNRFASALVISGMFSSTPFAEPIYHPSGPKLTFGGMTHRQMTVSDMGNPAYPAGIPYPEGDSGIYGVGLSIGLGIEYDGNDNLFKLLDSAADSGASVPGGGDGNSGEDGDSIIPILPPGTELTPEQQQQLNALVDEVAAAAVVIGLAVTGIEAKAFVSADIPVLISSDSLGAWTFGANTSITTNISGINDPINFDADIASSNLKTAFEATPPTSGSETYDLSGGASVTINPDGTTKFRIDNNSGVVTKAAQITEISIGYSRKVWQNEDNKAYIGVKPKLLDVGLSNTAIPISNIENAKDIFEALDNEDFKFEQDVSMDIGAIWSGKQYQLGATLTNINEPEFNYPEHDVSGFTNATIIKAIRDSERYVMERQLKLDAGYITSNGAWGFNFGYDVNAVPDPMGDDYQWLSIGAGFASDNWWLPGARLGLRKNMAGTELTYVTAGVTVFNIVNLDIASTTDTIDINGSTVPKGLIANIGVQVLF